MPDHSRQLWVYRILSILLASALAAALMKDRPAQVGSPAAESRRPLVDSRAPMAAEIEEIIRPLRYTFLPVLMRPEVSLQFDFQKDLWTLQNIHQFDPDGRLRLVDGRSGICGDLAIYTLQRIRPLLGDGYEIRLIRAAESSYFPAPLNTHFVISITDRRNPGEENSFILDPSFHRYGAFEQFDDYLFFHYVPGLLFAQKKERSHTDLVNRAVPVLLTPRLKMSLMATPEDKKFDRLNHGLAILVTLRSHYMPRTAFKISRRGGQRVVEEKTSVVGDLREVPEYDALRRRVTELFDQASVS